MWSVYLDTHPARVTSTRLLGMASRRAFVSPLALLRTGSVTTTELPGARWVRVRNMLAGVSPDDVDLIHLSPEALAARAFGRRRVFLGREVVGEVIEIGPEVELLRLGDRVAYQHGPCCATRDVEPLCRHCAAGNYALCDNRFQVKPHEVGGGWSEEMIVHEHQLYLVPDALSNEQAALLLPAARALHAVLRRVPEPGDTALVLGADQTGLLLLQTLRALAPNAPIAALPTAQYQVEFATRAGASHILHADDSLATVARIAGGRMISARGQDPKMLGGFDIIFDTLGTVDSLTKALAWVREGGSVVLAHHATEQPSPDVAMLARREVSLMGVSTQGTENWPPRGEHPAWEVRGTGTAGRIATMALAAALMAEGRLTPEHYVSHRFPLREIRSAIEVARDPEQHQALQLLLDIDTVETKGDTWHAGTQAAHPQRGAVADW